MLPTGYCVPVKNKTKSYLCKTELDVKLGKNKQDYKHRESNPNRERVEVDISKSDSEPLPTRLDSILNVLEKFIRLDFFISNILRKLINQIKILIELSN